MWKGTDLGSRGTHERDIEVIFNRECAGEINTSSKFTL